MKTKRFAIAGIVVAFLALAVTLILSFDLSALPEPGTTETALATTAKRFLVARASRSVPAEPDNLPTSTAEGQKRFGVECSMCHGLSGRTSTDAGRWMYPRAADLGSDQVQRYSNQELFWIIRNGIRLSGMPAFGRVETDQHIWDLVHYIRTLKAPTTTQ